MIPCDCNMREPWAVGKKKWDINYRYIGKSLLASLGQLIESQNWNLDYWLQHHIPVQEYKLKHPQKLAI